jgi:hypothetical protein
VYVTYAYGGGGSNEANPKKRVQGAHYARTGSSGGEGAHGARTGSGGEGRNGGGRNGAKARGGGPAMEAMMMRAQSTGHGDALPPALARYVDVVRNAGGGDCALYAIGLPQGAIEITRRRVAAHIRRSADSIITKMPNVVPAGWGNGVSSVPEMRMRLEQRAAAWDTAPQRSHRR